MFVVPLSCGEPAQAFRRLAGQPWAMLLDSAAVDAERGRYAFIVCDPVRVLTAYGRHAYADGVPVSDDPFVALEKAVASVGAECFPAAGAPFSGGAVGFLGYEFGAWREPKLTLRHPNLVNLPDMAVGIYDCGAVFDRLAGSAWVFAARDQAQTRALKLKQTLEAPPAGVGAVSAAPWRAELSRDAYLDRVARVQAYIRAGDIYQANFTQRFLAEPLAGQDAYALYERLRALSPAPFAAFLNCGPDLQIASASPERFFRLGADRMLEARPIKGTAPRCADLAADAAAAAALRVSVKDRAENLMITDLLRNDLGRVAELGSVRVPTLYGLESFTQVHHLVSVVTARLQAGLGPVDALNAAFPGGSITGAPKLRAMQIIDEVEAARRGPYCGSVVKIGFDGTLDASIIIRTLVMSAEGVIAQAGGGIVADSDPAAEYAEMRLKAQAMLRVLQEDRLQEDPLQEDA
jgi:para-aminobenzoate synthetase component I